MIASCGGLSGLDVYPKDSGLDRVSLIGDEAKRLTWLLQRCLVSELGASILVELLEAVGTPIEKVTLTALIVRVESGSRSA
jgi:hypothetical protein